MRVVTTKHELAAALQTSRASVLVPTMGALHAGHASLIQQGAEIAERRSYDGGCVVTIFVNPTQFNDAADFQRYPKTLEADLAICAANGAACVVTPTPEMVYPPDESIPVPPLPEQATKPFLEDRLRPGHFEGVCQVVLRLFQLTKPKAAIFGEKDWQQLQVVRAMTREQGLSIEIIPGPTVREEGGLAMSSRNRFLTPDERIRAFAISRGLRAAGTESTPQDAERRLGAELASAGIAPDYAVVRDAETLLAPMPGRPVRAIVAGRVGTVRLLDNAPWPNTK